jgi:precorrin-6B methylase 2
MSEILKYGWQRLQKNGCMVIACITEDCKYEVRQFIQNNKLLSNTEQVQLSISTGETLANKQLFRPQLSVTLIKVSK